MATLTRFIAVLGLASAGLIGCTTTGSGEAPGVRTERIVVAPGDEPPTIGLPDGGSVEPVMAQALSAFPRERAFVDAGRDAECHDACPARCDEDEICCYATGFCVPLDCWECCSDTDPGRAIGHAAAEDP